MFTFIFKDTSANSLFREDDVNDFGSIAPLGTTEKDFVVSSSDIDDKIVNVGIHFENADEDIDTMRMLKLMGAEYPNTAGLYLTQSYVINGIITKNPDGSIPTLNIVNEIPEEISVTAADEFTFYLKELPIDAAVNIVIVDSANGPVTWTQTAPTVLTPDVLPGVSGVLTPATGKIVLTYTGVYDAPDVDTIRSTYDLEFINKVTDTGREELEDTYLKVQTNDKTTTTATFKIVSASGIALTNSIDVLDYDPLLKTLSLDSGLVDITTGLAYIPAENEKYKITGSSTRYVSYNQGTNDTTKFLFAVRSARMQTPNDKVVLTIGLDMPTALFLSNQAEASLSSQIKPVITYSLE